jgi:hypothetical protein
MQQLILGTGTALWWLTEPHSLLDRCIIADIFLLRTKKYFSKLEFFAEKE